MAEKTEIWKDIPFYENYYQASSFGRIRSLDREINSSFNAKRTIKGDILSMSIGTTGYMTIRLSKDGKGRTIKVHKLIAMAFLDHSPNGFELVVNHKDFNRRNNSVENLEVISQRENGNMKHLKHSSIYTGVHWNKIRKKWSAQIMKNKIIKRIGMFENEYDAHLAYENELKNIKI